MPSPRPISPADLSEQVATLFWSKTERVGECIVWRGATAPNGYGKFSRGFAPNARRYNAHRYAYAITHGDTDAELDHLCRNRSCVNPAHLEPVTRMENVRRAMPANCPAGRPYVEGNLDWDRGRPGQSPIRRCKTCRLAQQAARNQRRRAA